MIFKQCTTFYRVNGVLERHEVYEHPLRANAELHRFENVCGVPYSAIYVENVEQFSCERKKEAEMIKAWNEGD